MVGYPSVSSYLDAYPSLGQRVFIDPAARVIGQVRLGDDVSIWPMAVVRGDVNHIVIGSATNIQDGAILHVTHDGPYTKGGYALTVGHGVTVGHQAMLHGCTIDDFCLIGMGAIIMDNVHLEHHVMLAAGSVVPPNKTLQSYGLYLGNPARRVRDLTKEEIEQLEYSAGHYVRLKDRYLDNT